MNYSTDPARARAFALYEASGGAMTNEAVLAHCAFPGANKHPQLRPI